MNAINDNDPGVQRVRDFFRRHGAVRASSSGPSWKTANEEALLEWHAAYRSIVVSGIVTRAGGPGWRETICDATPAERDQVRPMYFEIRAEIMRRSRLPGASYAIQAVALCIKAASA